MELIFEKLWRRTPSVMNGIERRVSLNFEHVLFPAQISSQNQETSRFEVVHDIDRCNGGFTLA